MPAQPAVKIAVRRHNETNFLTASGNMNTQEIFAALVK